MSQKKSPWWGIAKEAFEVFEDIRGAVGMYMFIIEESIQTANMGNWILFKAELYNEMKENIEWIRSELANPLKDFCENPVANVAYPLNLSYAMFAEATLKSLEAQETAIAELSQEG